MKHLLILMAFCGFVSCNQSKSMAPSGNLGLENIRFVKWAGQEEVVIPPEMAGYVIVYLNLEEDCSSCIKIMNQVIGVAQHYEGVRSIMLNRGTTGVDILAAKLDGARLEDLWVDTSKSLQTLLFLQEGPALIFLDREMKLVSILRHADLVGLSNMNAHFHKIMGSL